MGRSFFQPRCPRHHKEAYLIKKYLGHKNSELQCFHYKYGETFQFFNGMEKGRVVKGSHLGVREGLVFCQVGRRIAKSVSSSQRGW
jgi:hypothetical protein